MLPRLEKTNTPCITKMQSVLDNCVLGSLFNITKQQELYSTPTSPLTSVCFPNAQCAFHTSLLTSGNYLFLHHS